MTLLEQEGSDITEGSNGPRLNLYKMWMIRKFDGNVLCRKNIKLSSAVCTWLNAALKWVVLSCEAAWGAGLSLSVMPPVYLCCMLSNKCTQSVEMT